MAADDSMSVCFGPKLLNLYFAAALCLDFPHLEIGPNPWVWEAYVLALFRSRHECAIVLITSFLDHSAEPCQPSSPDHCAPVKFSVINKYGEQSYLVFTIRVCDIA